MRCYEVMKGRRPQVFSTETDAMGFMDDEGEVGRACAADCVDNTTEEERRPVHQPLTWPGPPPPPPFNVTAINAPLPSSYPMPPHALIWMANITKVLVSNSAPGRSVCTATAIHPPLHQISQLAFPATTLHATTLHNHSPFIFCTPLR